MRPPVRLLTAATAVLLLTGCGSDRSPAPSAREPADTPTPAARAQLAAHAAAAKDLVGVRHYSLVTSAGTERTVTVVRARDRSWRVDLPGTALDGIADIAIARTADGLFHCTLPSHHHPDPARCVEIEQLDVDTDPRVHHVFTGWLDVLTDRRAPLSVAPTARLEGAAGECFAVEASAAALEPSVDAGIYCYDGDGTLTGARLGFGTLTLVSTGESVPESVDLPGAVVEGDPVPLVAPTPDPSPDPASGPSPGPSPRSTDPQPGSP